MMLDAQMLNQAESQHPKAKDFLIFSIEWTTNSTLIYNETISYIIISSI